ncbi:hypothetical protein FRC02_002661 [Tulasnella sp. 418]|nr:hypothetical protein FRC02_002661 [Tulasnella sp. 418]
MGDQRDTFVIPQALLRALTIPDGERASAHQSESSSLFPSSAYVISRENTPSPALSETPTHHKEVLVGNTIVLESRRLSSSSVEASTSGRPSTATTLLRIAAANSKLQEVSNWEKQQTSPSAMSSAGPIHSMNPREEDPYSRSFDYRSEGRSSQDDDATRTSEDGGRPSTHYRDSVSKSLKGLVPVAEEPIEFRRSSRTSTFGRGTTPADSPTPSISIHGPSRRTPTPQELEDFTLTGSHLPNIKTGTEHPLRYSFSASQKVEGEKRISTLSHGDPDVTAVVDSSRPDTGYPPTKPSSPHRLTLQSTRDSTNDYTHGSSVVLSEYGKKPSNPSHIPRSSYYVGPPPVGSAFGSEPMGQIGYHFPREIVRIERDYSGGGELPQFYPTYPLEFEGRITPTQFQESLNEINEVLISAHSLRHSALEHVLGVMTLYLSVLVIETHYEKEMKRLARLFERLNAEVYNPVGLNLLWPRKTAFMFVSRRL